MTTDPITTYHCPQCGVLLESTGTITVDGTDYPLFQCDECVVTKPVFGEPFPVALTFCVNATGKPFDPVDNEPIL